MTFQRKLRLETFAAYSQLTIWPSHEKGLFLGGILHPEYHLSHSAAAIFSILSIICAIVQLPYGDIPTLPISNLASLKCTLHTVHSTHYTVYSIHLRFKQAQPKMCHSPKVVNRVDSKKFFFDPYFQIFF